MKLLYFILSGWVLSFLPQQILAQIYLPAVFTDHMVLQRDMPVKLWGKAGKGETVNLYFNKQQVTVHANETGQWEAEFKPMTWGGPFDLKIEAAGHKKIVHDILIGDVWVCSGQSNMEFPVKGWSQVNNADEEIANANYPNIRLFTVERNTSFIPEQEVKGGQWLPCNSDNIPSFSAVAYFFGRKINADTKIPIGLISTNWGGTNVQAWTSFEAIAKQPTYQHFDFEKTKKLLMQQSSRKAAYEKALKEDAGSREQWYKNTDLQDWKIINMPSLWESSAIGNTDGIVWFKKKFVITNELPIRKARLSLGAIDDADSTYINGKLVGADKSWDKDRVYTVDASLLHKGDNTITIKMIDNSAQGGMSGKQEQLFIEVDNTKIPLSGEWLYKPSVLSSKYQLLDSGPNGFPSQLFNAMIAPLLRLKIKGAIWYQGEANTGEAERYENLFPAMIADWRQQWGYDFPFLWVQLANYLAKKTEPGESEWAELRNAQHQTLAVPNTAEAVIADLGEANDIHPRNKQDVGLRLAMAAEKLVYGKKVVASGPTLASFQIENGRIILNFYNLGDGLMAKNNHLTGFAIAGADKKFVWAKATIKGNKIIVESSEVPHPEAVRYAWADNPDLSLYNKNGFPASPFRTDKWPLVTKDKKLY